MPAPTAAETITEPTTDTVAAIDQPTTSDIGPSAAPGARRRRGPITLLVGLAVLSTLLLFALAVVALTDGGEAVDPDPASDAEAGTPARKAG